MNTILWIIQGILAAMFLMAGMMKVAQSKDALREKVGGWVDDFKDGQIKLIGFLEILGALGLILPMLLDILPLLTSVAAIGLILTMVGAARVHLKRKEMKNVIMNVMLLILAAIVAYGRLQ